MRLCVHRSELDTVGPREQPFQSSTPSLADQESWKAYPDLTDAALVKRQTNVSSTEIAFFFEFSVVFFRRPPPPQPAAALHSLCERRREPYRHGPYARLTITQGWICRAVPVDCAPRQSRLVCLLDTNLIESRRPLFPMCFHFTKYRTYHS